MNKGEQGAKSVHFKVAWEMTSLCYSVYGALNEYVRTLSWPSRKMHLTSRAFEKDSSTAVTAFLATAAILQTTQHNLPHGVEQCGILVFTSISSLGK